MKTTLCRPFFKAALILRHCPLTYSSFLAAATFLLLSPAGNTFAGSATWDLNPGSGDWNTAANWTPMTVPNASTDTATFALSNLSAVSISANTEVNGIRFTPAATNPYTITASGGSVLIFTGTGISNNSGTTQSFVTAPAATGSFVANQFIFRNSANAGSFTVFTNDGSDGESSGGQTLFHDTSSAGNATFNNNGPVGAGFAGGTFFFDSSTAANGHFINEGSTIANVGPAGTLFVDNATAAHGTFVNDGGKGNGADGGETFFGNNSTAANGIFVNNGGTVNGAFGGSTGFQSTANNATITNNGGSVSGAFGGSTGFGGVGTTPATAENAIITNNGGIVSGASGGITDFRGFLLSPGFFGSATAGNATITNNGANVSGGGGGETIFSTDSSNPLGASSAGNATLIASGGSGGGQGGAILFKGFSTGGTSRIEVFGNGGLDISFHNAPGVTVGSIEGDGNVFLGANNLTVGSSNIGTTFSGVIQDGGQNGGTGGSLTKIGTGTLDLTGTNTYTGNTNINRGVLKVDGSITSNTFVDHGGTLAGTGTVQGDVTNNGVVSPGDAPGTLTVNGNYNQNSRGSLLIDIAGTNAGEFSVLDVLGNAKLSGVLDPVLLNGFVPTVGESFTFLNYASLTGKLFIFDRNIDNAAEHWKVAYNPTNAILTVAPGNVALPDTDSTLLLLTLSLFGLAMLWLKTWKAVELRNRAHPLDC